MVKAKNVVNLNVIELLGFIDASNKNIRAQLLLELDRKLIGSCLHRYGGNQTKVAEVLGINRGTLRTRMKELGLLECVA